MAKTKRKQHPAPPAPVDVLSIVPSGSVYLQAQDRTRRVNNPIQIVTEGGQYKWKNLTTEAAVYTDEGEAQPADTEPMMEPVWTEEAYTVDFEGVTFKVSEVDADGNVIAGDLLPFSLDDVPTAKRTAYVDALRGVLKWARKDAHNIDE